MLPLSLALAVGLIPPPTDSPAWAKPEVRAALADVTAKLQVCRDGRWTLGDDGKPDVEGVITALDKLLEAVGEKEAAKIAKSEHVWLAKLVALALHRRQNPKLHDELGQTYGDHTQRDNRPQKEWDRALSSRGGIGILPRRKIFQNHLADEYRLAWEFRLLVLPRLQELHEGYSVAGAVRTTTQPCCRVTAEAVYSFGDERSIPTLLTITKCQYLRMFEGMMLPDDDMLDLFTCLSRHQTEVGLRAVLDWAAWTEGFYKEVTDLLSHGKPSDMKIVPRELLAGLAQAKGSEWTALAKKLPVEGLSVRERELREVIIAVGERATTPDKK
jgi:hypothetical protein